MTDSEIAFMVMGMLITLVVCLCLFYTWFILVHLFGQHNDFVTIRDLERDNTKMKNTIEWIFNQSTDNEVIGFCSKILNELNKKDANTQGSI